MIKKDSVWKPGATGYVIVKTGVDVDTTTFGLDFDTTMFDVIVRAHVFGFAVNNDGSIDQVVAIESEDLDLEVMLPSHSNPAL